MVRHPHTFIVYDQEPTFMLRLNGWGPVSTRENLPLSGASVFVFVFSHVLFSYFVFLYFCILYRELWQEILFLFHSICFFKFLHQEFYCMLCWLVMCHTKPTKTFARARSPSGMYHLWNVVRLGIRTRDIHSIRLTKERRFNLTTSLLDANFIIKKKHFHLIFWTWRTEGPLKFLSEIFWIFVQFVF